MIRAIAARFERSLVVTLIGPSGSGKSTLVNALAGGAELSPTGHRRPTTDTLVVFGAGQEDAAELTRELAAIRSPSRPRPGMRLPQGLCLIDTPDTDSMPSAATFPRWSGRSPIRTCCSASSMPKPKRRESRGFSGAVRGAFRRRVPRGGPQQVRPPGGGRS